MFPEVIIDREIPEQPEVPLDGVARIPVVGVNPWGSQPRRSAGLIQSSDASRFRLSSRHRLKCRDV